MWGDSSRQLASEVASSELVSRFVREKEIVRATTPWSIQPKRLMPVRNKTTNRLEVSVCRSGQLSQGDVWSLATRHIDAHSPKPSIGHCVTAASTVFAEKLDFDADGEPFPEHANIVGWHDDSSAPDDELKHFWKNQAQRMAPKFHFKARS
jgi:hypothetical protein